MNNVRQGWVYVLTHPAWDKIGLVKIGMTGRDPSARAAEITSVSGLIAPCRVAWCMWVEDRAEVERAVKHTLKERRVRGRRELFRSDVLTARRAIEGSSCRKGVVFIGRRRMVRRRPRLDRNWAAIVVVASLALIYLIFVRV